MEYGIAKRFPTFIHTVCIGEIAKYVSLFSTNYELILPVYELRTSRVCQTWRMIIFPLSIR
jgi:riboflavin transporter FmnP